MKVIENLDGIYNLIVSLMCGSGLRVNKAKLMSPLDL